MPVSGKFVTAERMLLRPLSVVCGIGGGAYLFSGVWVVGVLLLLVAFFIGIIGQGLPHHTGQGFRELAHGSAADPQEYEDNLDMTPAETIKMGRVAMFTGLWSGLAAGAVAGHHGLRWYFAVPVGAVIGIAILVLVGTLIVRACPRKSEP